MRFSREREWVTPVYSITLSTVASNLDGSFRPNVLAVLSRRFSLSVPSALDYRSFATRGELTMKTILVPTQNIPTMKSTLETAVLLAQRTSAYVEGVPLWFGVPEFVVAEMASTFPLKPIERGATKRRRERASCSKLSCRNTVLLLRERSRTDLRLAGLLRCRRVKTLSAAMAAHSM
jgi:hypothetical protein